MSTPQVGVAITASASIFLMRAWGGWPFVACFLFGWLLDAFLAGFLQ